MISAVMWMNLEITLPRERGHEASSTYEPTRRINVVPGGWETGWGGAAHRHRVSFWGHRWWPHSTVTVPNAPNRALYIGSSHLL